MYVCMYVCMYIYIYICIYNVIAENCGDLRRLSFSPVKWPRRSAEICGDGESAQRPRRKTNVKLPARSPPRRRSQLAAAALVAQTQAAAEVLEDYYYHC